MSVKAVAEVHNDDVPAEAGMNKITLTMKGKGRVYVEMGGAGLEVSGDELEEALRRVATPDYDGPF